MEITVSSGNLPEDIGLVLTTREFKSEDHGNKDNRNPR
jgi:hypothetical protein